jgi:hypothetical protein
MKNIMSIIVIITTTFIIISIEKNSHSLEDL